jgi:transposase
MSPIFDSLYSFVGRPSIPPEKLLRAQLLQILYSIRSERMLVEQLRYNFLFRWFVGMSGTETTWDPSTYAKNRDRFLGGDVAGVFFDKVLEKAEAAGLTSDEHFSVDGSLIEAWASHKSFRPKDSDDSQDPPSGNAGHNFRGEKRSNATHQSTTDPDARLYKKSKGDAAKMALIGHVLSENRNGLVVNAKVTLATGKAERQAAVAMIAELGGEQRLMLGADEGYDTREFVASLRLLKVTPHVAQNNKSRKSAVDGRTTRHEGYAMSQRKRKLVEEFFGWMKTVGVLRKTRHKGVKLVDWMFTFTAAAYNLVRIRTLCPA